MNDRFKFRVWDTEIKEYLVGCFLVGGSNMIHNSVDYESFLNKGNFVIEQCTGLKDKNGKLIFEGDIVKAITNTYKVIWDRYRWAIKDSQGYIFSEYINDLLYDCEIIGNIHEQEEQKDK